MAVFYNIHYLVNVSGQYVTLLLYLWLWKWTGQCLCFKNHRNQRVNIIKFCEELVNILLVKLSIYTD
mgnify:FL=1